MTARELGKARVFGGGIARRGAPATRGNNPRTNEAVWRNSYTEGQIEGRLWQPYLGRAGIRGIKRRIGAVLKVARELEKRTRRTRQKQHPRARNGVLGHIGLVVLEALYQQFLDYKTGKLEPAIATIADKVGHTYAAVHKALVRLRDHGFLAWMRRSRPLDNAGQAGPQVEQITNAYVLLVPAELEHLVAHLLGRTPIPDDERCRRAKQDADYKEMLARLSCVDFVEAVVVDHTLAGILARFGASIDAQERESSKTGETGGV